MRGGNMITQSEESQKVLREYGLHRGGPIDADISDEVKKQFLEQLKNSNCAVGTGDNIILNNECSAVVQVIRALIDHNIKKVNGQPLPKSIRTKHETIDTKPNNVPQPSAQQEVINTDSYDAPEVISTNNDNMLNKYTEIEENPSDFHGNDSGEYAHIDFNLKDDRVPGPYFSNFKIDDKPIRVRGATPDFVVRKSRKMKKGKSGTRKLSNNQTNKTQKQSNNLENKYKKPLNTLNGKTRRNNKQNLKNLLNKFEKSTGKKLELDKTIPSQNEPETINIENIKLEETPSIKNTNIRSTEVVTRTPSIASKNKTKANKKVDKPSKSFANKNNVNKFKNIFKGGKTRRRNS
jgi:hypothetical protein